MPPDVTLRRTEHHLLSVPATVQHLNLIARKHQTNSKTRNIPLKKIQGEEADRILKNVVVIKDEEMFRNCSKLQKTKEK